MYFLYSLLLTLGLVALSPLFLVAALRHGKYRSGLGERLGGVPPLVNTGRRPVIWLHCVSVGETQAARPLVQELLRRYPTHALAVSTTTLTGQRLARETFGKDAEAVFYFPLDFAWPVRRALTAIRPAAVLLMETELWPRFLRECSAGRVPVAIVNGRISEKSFRGYRRLGLLARYAVKDLSLALMQTDGDAERIEALGLAPARIHVSGNIKFDLETGAGDGQLTEELRARFGIDGRRPLIVAASTHAPEESICLDAFKLLNDTATGHTRPRLLLAPRHPERFNDVATLLDAAALNWSRRSVSPAETDQVSDIILLDSIGELRAVYPLAELVFVGGSIARHGGHNILEPAAAARCILTGPHTFNFEAIVRAFREQKALVQLPESAQAETPAALADLLRELLGDEERRAHMGQRARAALDASRGATERTIRLLAPLLESRGVGSEEQTF